LVAIEVKDYKEMRRFFFLYEFYSISTFFEKRLILDYTLGSQTIVPIDWSNVKNCWQYSVIEWA
jgi:hypothetical protein